MDVSHEGMELTRYFFSEKERPNPDALVCLLQAEIIVKDLLKKPLQSHQHVALVCLVSDIVAGVVSSSNGIFETSFLWTALNRGMYQVASAEFYTFCFTEGKLNHRAWQKRRAEQQLFLTGKLLFPSN